MQLLAEAPTHQTHNAQSTRSLIDLRQVIKAYETPAGDFLALKGIDLQVNQGEFLAIVGKSGSGKSTLINMMTGIDRPTRGEVFMNAQPIHGFSENQMAQWRGRQIGIIFQFFQLLPMLTCLENIILPMDFAGLYTRRQRKQKALHWLEEVGLVDQAHKFPSELSGGQQQRIAIARALANDPPIIVADEPTGNLDSNTADTIFRLFNQLVTRGKTIVMVTHDSEIAQKVTRTITIADGRIANDSRH